MYPIFREAGGSYLQLQQHADQLPQAEEQLAFLTKVLGALILLSHQTCAIGREYQLGQSPSISYDTDVTHPPSAPQLGSVLTAIFIPLFHIFLSLPHFSGSRTDTYLLAVGSWTGFAAFGRGPSPAQTQ